MPDAALRILVVFANHGTKNRHYFAQVLAAWRSMPFAVRMVALSDRPKDLGPDVEVRAGAPTSNPWSLPFGHRRIFLEHRDDFDLFVYSEDDTLIEERHVRAFLDAQRKLPPDEIAGFLRYELDEDGSWYCSSAHSHYRWIPGSVVERSGETFARFSNAHSACYLITREQLVRAIDSGGFPIEPWEGRYDMLCTAATDPYTSCGMRKVVSLTRLDDFMLHHLPNAYLGRIGMSRADFQAQVDALVAMGPGEDSPLIPLRTRLESTSRWDRHVDLPIDADVLDLLPANGASILSFGCGTGRTERELVRRGARVVAVPLDPICAAPAAAAGVALLPPVTEQALAMAVERGPFDAVLVHSVLERVSDPPGLVAALGALLTTGGTLVAASPNFQRSPRLTGARWTPAQLADYRKVGDLEASGLQRTTARVLRRWLRAAALRPTTIRWKMHPRGRRLARYGLGLLEPWLAHGVTIAARRH